ncbi:hypothetical protein ACFX15_012826 [Malus domestica]
MASGEEAIHYLSVNFEDSLDLEERFDDNIHLVGSLLADNEPSEHVIKEVMRIAWNKMGVVKVLKTKPNIYAINVGEEAVARRLLEGNPWFNKDYTSTIKLWQAHGVPRHLCTMKNAIMGEMLGAVLEVEDHFEIGFRNFLWLQVDFDGRRPLVTCFQIPFQKTGSRLLRLKYEGLRIFCYRCGRLGHRMVAHGWRHQWLREQAVCVTSCVLPLPPKHHLCYSRQDKTIAAIKEKSDIAPFVILSTPNTDLSEADTLIPKPSGFHLPRLNNIPDDGHMWHPDSFGIQFTNGALTIAVNSLSLSKS